MIDENTYLTTLAVFLTSRQRLLYAGENDIHRGKTPELTLQHFKEYAATNWETLPNTQINYITMKPSILWWADFENMKIANVALMEKR